MAFLHLLEGLRTPWLNTVMSGVTFLGSEGAFLALALGIFWCVSKREGYYLLSVGFFGTILNQFLKLWFRIPRPWVQDSGLTIVESARAGATGYSFPSGHTQNAVGTFGGIARFTRRRGLRALCIGAAVLVPFSRMYLGVHTPLDVSVAFATGAALVFAVYPLFRCEPRKSEDLYALFGAMVLCAVAYVAFVTLYPFPADVDAENLAEGMKNAWTLLGATVGVVLVYWADRNWIGFETEAVWWAQVLKLALGLGLVLGVKTVLKAPLLALCGGHPAAHAIRYFIVVLLAGGAWPMTFGFFSSLGQKR